MPRLENVSQRSFQGMHAGLTALLTTINVALRGRPVAIKFNYPSAFGLQHSQ